MSGESSEGRKACIVIIFLYDHINIAVIKDVSVCGMVNELNILNGETLSTKLATVC
jgi:hypothetical protein